MSCFTLTWHPNLHPSANSLRVKLGISVGNGSPPPSNTLHLHCKQEPPPPQADGKKILLFPKVVKSVLPPPTSISFSPLILIFTASLTSCKKDYTCDCTINGGEYKTTISHTTQSDASKKCKEKAKAVGEKQRNYEYECTVK